MALLIQVQQADESHAVVWRVDYTLSGSVLVKQALLPNGAWRPVGERQPVPDECILPLLKAD